MEPASGCEYDQDAGTVILEPEGLDLDGVDLEGLPGLAAVTVGDAGRPLYQEPRLESGDRIGRYRLVQRLGAGGMGVVWVARDPRLDRTVAIKVLHEQRRRGATMARERLRREALALARLSHPNVVSIYDVGIHQDRVFLTMEHVEGRTLDVWASKGPSLPEVLDVFEQATAGLVAVHEAGFVHRDFKPTNVMIDREGRVQVMDFGLARLCDSEGGVELEATASSSAAWNVDASRLFSTVLTADGVAMGTPAYMAPEQHTGDAADARADQFSLCATLYEVLMGRRPFQGRSVKELAQQKHLGRIDFRGGRLRLPRALRSLLRRGLHPVPEGRYRDLRALRAALARLRRPGRSRRLAWAAAGVMIVGGTGWASLGSAGADACEQGARRMAEVWDDDARARVRRSFEATELSYAADAAGRATERLDAYAEAWADAHGRACEATPADVAALDLRMGCLSRARAALATTVGLLVEADATTVQHAVDQVTGLPSLAHCADVAALEAEVPPPRDPAAVAEVEAIEAALETARALGRAGHYAPGHEHAVRALEKARALEHEPSIARAQTWVAMLDLDLGDPEKARQGLTEAALLAAGVGDHRTAAEAATRLVYVYSEALGRADEAMSWARHAEASLGRMPPDPLAEARLHGSLGIAHAVAGNHDEAAALFERSYEAKREILGEDHPEVVRALQSIAISYGEVGRTAESEQIMRRVLTTLEALLGASHPDFGLALVNLGQTVDHLGRHDEAAQHYTRALGIYRAALGPEHPWVARTLESLGHVASTQDRLHEAEAYFRQASEIMAATLGERHREYAWTIIDQAIVTSKLSRDEEALALYARAREILEAAGGAEHDSLAYMLMSESVSLVELRRLDQAEQALQRAQEIFSARLPPGHPAFGFWRANRGDLRRAQEQLEPAREDFLAALEIVSGALGPEHLDNASILQALGEVEHGLHDVESARDHLRRALALVEQGAVGEAFRASVRFSLAKVLWDDPATRAEAQTLARSAHAGFSAYGDVFDEDVEEIDAWWREHRRG